MLSDLLHGKFPRTLQIDRSWAPYLTRNDDFDTYGRVIPCMSVSEGVGGTGGTGGGGDDDTEVDLTLPVTKFDLRLHNVRDDVLFEPFRDSLPPEHYSVQLQSSDRGLLKDYPVLESFFAQKYGLISDFDSGLPMQQVKFVFYRPHSRWSKFMRYQMQLLAGLMSSGSLDPSPAPPPRRPAGTDERDVGYFLYFSKRQYCFDTMANMYREMTTRVYPNVVLAKSHLDEDVEQLNEHSACIRRCIESKLVQATGVVSVTDFTFRQKEVEDDDDDGYEQDGQDGQEGQDERRRGQGKPKLKRRTAARHGLPKPRGSKRKKCDVEAEAAEEKDENKMLISTEVETVCAICYDESIKATTRCSEVCCSKRFHTTCLQAWAQTAAAHRIVFISENVATMSCPTCTCPMIVQMMTTV